MDKPETMWKVSEDARGKDKMSSINLEEYYKKHADNKKWLQILSKFPEDLQRELIDERPYGEENDVKEFSPYFLADPEPIEIQLETVFRNLDGLVYLPPEVAKAVNKRWNTNAAPLIGVSEYDTNRFRECAKMPGSTAKPSVMVDGQIWMGWGRFMSALLRGDKTLKVWNLRSK